MNDKSNFGVGHLSNKPKSLQSDEECLDSYYQKFSWLRALLLAIQADEDIEPGEHLYHLAQIGEHLAETWMEQIDVQRQESEAASVQI